MGVMVSPLLQKRPNSRISSMINQITAAPDITVRVEIPKNLTHEQKELLRKLGESFGETGAVGKKKGLFR